MSSANAQTDGPSTVPQDNPAAVNGISETQIQAQPEEWIAADFPEVVRATEITALIAMPGIRLDYKEVARMIEFDGDGSLEEQAVELVTRENLRRLKFDPKAIAGTFIQTGVTYAMSLPESDRLSAITDELLTHTPSNISRQRLDFLAERVEENTQLYAEYLEIGRQFDRRLDLASLSIEDQFYLTTWFAASLEDGQGTDVHPHDLVWGQVMVKAADHDGRPSVPEQLLSRLEAGEFDDLLTEALLQETDDQDPTELEPNDPLAKLLRLARSLGVEDENIYAKLMAAKADWPREAVSFVEEEHQKLRVALKRYPKALRVLADTMYLPYPHPNPLSDFREALKVFGTIHAKQAHAQGTKLEQVQRAVEKKRRRGEAGRNLPLPVQVETVQEERRPLELTYLDYLSGEIYPRDSKEFKKLVNDYIQAQQGNPKLADDIETILEHISQLDFSGGVLRGIKKHTMPVAVQGQKLGVLRIKPQEMIGLSTSTAEAKRIRILVTLLDDNRLGILGIARRDQIDRFEKKLGILSNSMRNSHKNS